MCFHNRTLRCCSKNVLKQFGIQINSLLLTVCGSAGINRRPWWRHQMETFSALLALCVGNSRGASIFFFICAWINGWVNNPEAGDLRRHRAHCDVRVMVSQLHPDYQHASSTTDTWCQSISSGTIHYDDVIMSAIASQITSLTIVYSTVYPDVDQSKHQSSASLAFVWGIHRGPVNSPHKWPVTRKMFPFDDVIMFYMIMRTPASRAGTSNYTPQYLWDVNTCLCPLYLLLAFMFLYLVIDQTLDISQ